MGDQKRRWRGETSGDGLAAEGGAGYGGGDANNAGDNVIADS